MGIKKEFERIEEEAREIEKEVRSGVAYLDSDPVFLLPAINRKLDLLAHVLDWSLNSECLEKAIDEYKKG